MSERSLKWFKSYLVDRRQCMCINAELSRQIDLGFLQGSILEPLIFNVYVNCLPTCVKKCRMILYADDAILIYAASTPESLQDNFLHDFKLMYGSTGGASDYLVVPLTTETKSGVVFHVS